MGSILDEGRGDSICSLFENIMFLCLCEFFIVLEKNVIVLRKRKRKLLNLCSEKEKGLIWKWRRKIMNGIVKEIIEGGDNLEK